MDVEAWKKHFNSLVQNQKILKDLVNETHQSELAQNLQIEQWNRGEDSEGRIMGRYTKATEELSNGRKKAGSPFNLKDTGAFRKATRLEGRVTANNIEFNLDSEDVKTNLLIDKIGNNIFGLQVSGKIKLIDFLEQKFIEKLKPK